MVVSVASLHITSLPELEPSCKLKEEVNLWVKGFGTRSKIKNKKRNRRKLEKYFLIITRGLEKKKVAKEHPRKSAIYEAREKLSRLANKQIKPPHR